MTALGCAVALTAGVVACQAVENLTAGQKLSRAFDRLGEQKSLSVEVGLDATADQLIALARQESPDEEMPREAAELLAGGTITFDVQAKKPLKDAGENDITAAGLTLAKDSTDLAEIRVVDDTAYVRADLRQIAEISGEEMPPIEEITEGMPPEFAFMEKFFEGKWISFDSAEADKLNDRMKEFTGESGTSGSGKADGKPSLSDSAQDKIFKSVKQILGRDVTIDDKGKSDGADHIVVTAPARTLVSDLIKELEPLKGEFPGGELPTAEDLKDVPNRKVSADFYIKGGKLSKLSLDLNQLQEKPSSGKLPLTVGFGDAGEINAPLGATEITGEDIEGLMGQMFGGAFTTGGSYDEFEELEELDQFGDGGAGDGGFAFEDEGAFTNA